MTTPFPQHIKIAVVSTNFTEDEIYAVSNERGSRLYLYDAFIIQLLSEALLFSFSIILSRDGFGEKTAVGNWTGVFGMLQREEADFAIDGLSLTEERTQVADFSNPYHITGVTFLTRNPEPLPKNLAIFYPYDFRVWITITVFSFVVSVLFYNMKRRTTSYQYLLLRVFGSLLGQDLELSIRSGIKRFIFLTWIIGVMFLSYVYQGLLLSFLSMPPMEKGVRDIADLSKAVADSTHACFTYEGSYVIRELMGSSDLALRVIGKSLLENAMEELDVLKLLQMKKPKSAFITARSTLEVYDSHFFLSEDSFFTTAQAVAVRKTFCCKKELDKVVRRIFETGLQKKFLRERDLRELSKLNSYPVKYDGIRALSMADLEGTFRLIIMGHILASTLFVLEYFSRKKLQICSLRHRIA